jgi:hypothetical protein
LRVCGGLVIFREFISFHFILKVGSQRGVAKSQKKKMVLFKFFSELDSIPFHYEFLKL